MSKLFARYGLVFNFLTDQSDIPYSFWGAPEAGRKKNHLFLRNDTPVHSILHETSHYVCMPLNQRKSNSHDAAGGISEENASCYLQILLSDHITGYSREQQMQDMDQWGYTFRLGSAQKWFENDAEDSKIWLQDLNIITNDGHITWKLRD